VDFGKMKVVVGWGVMSEEMTCNFVMVWKFVCNFAGEMQIFKII